jgi:hypothetical protein
MELGQVTEALRAADDANRFAVAREIAEGASPQELVAVAKLLVGDDRALRLGAISVLRAASFKPAAGALIAVAKSRAGSERAAALHALADLCSPADKDKLLPALAASKDDPGDDVQEARSRLMTLCAPREQLAEQTGTQTMLFGLLAPDKDKRRAALVAVLKDHGAPERVLADAEKIADAVDIATAGGDGDVLALFARMTERKLKEAPAEIRQRVAKRLLAALKSTDSLIAKEALRSAARHIAPELAVVSQAADVASLESDELSKLLDALTELEDDARVPAISALVDGLMRAPARVGVFAEALYGDLDRLDVVAKTKLAALCLKASAATTDDEDLQRHLGPLARLYARVVLPGARVPDQLVVGLRLSPDDKDRLALIELLACVRTEESAAGLVALLGGQASDDIKARALSALKAFESSEVEVLLHPDETVELLPRYATPQGERLVADGRMLLSKDGQRWMLSADGAPVRETDTPHGGCRCCHRPHALLPPAARDEDDKDAPPPRPTCPITGKKHLVEVDGPLLEAGHPLGGCVVCESLRPLERSGQRVTCTSCHQVYEREGDRYVPKKQKPRAEVTYSYAAEEGAPPKRSDVLPDIDDKNIIPPTEQDLDDLPEDVVRAMRANVVLYGRGSFKEWGGTGIIIARVGDEIAILTARQNVEETDGESQGQRVPVKCVTITGEVAPTRVVWIAQGGVDLAVLAANVEDVQSLADVPLAGARAPKLGADLFAVGNQLGFPWSYSSGSVSGLRTLTTSGGLDSRPAPAAAACTTTTASSRASSPGTASAAGATRRTSRSPRTRSPRRCAARRCASRASASRPTSSALEPGKNRTAD